MASNNVEILIKADDQASAKMRDVGKSAGDMNKQFKETGAKAKASTEFVGTLANALGGTELGKYASQLAGMTEKMSQFSEVSKEGGIGALAFKAGLVAMVGTIAIGIGKALGDVIFQTEKWAAELERATQQAKELSAAIQSATQSRFGEELADLRAISDVEERRIAAQKAFEQLGKEQQGTQRTIADLTKQIEQRTNQWSSVLSRASGNYRGITEQLKGQLEDAKSLAKTQQEQVLAVLKLKEAEDLISQNKKQAADDAARLVKSSQDQVQALRDELELLQSKDKIATEYAQKVRRGELGAGGAKVAEDLARQIDAEKEVQDAAKAAAVEKDRLAQKAAADAEKEREKEAKDAEEKAKAFGQATNLGATESRLLTRGPGQDSAEKQLKESQETNKILKEIEQKFDAQGRYIPGGGESLKVELVS